MTPVRLRVVRGLATTGLAMTGRVAIRPEETTRGAIADRNVTIGREANGAMAARREMGEARMAKKMSEETSRH